MSDEVWISSMEAVHRVREAGFSPGDLAIWAEKEGLRSRAGQAWFGEDADGEERNFVDGQSRHRSERAANDTWPDVPAEFWYWLNRDLASDKANWGAGVFTTVVFEYARSVAGDSTPSRDYREYIRLYDVKFMASDLAKLLRRDRPTSLKGALPAHATASDRRYEEHAHEAAQIVREQGISATLAFTKVMEGRGRLIVRKLGSEESAIRRSFKLMYDKHGMPIKIDHD